MEEDESYPIKYMSFGSPLMDCIADVSKEFIDNNKIELNTTTHKKLKEIKFLNEFLSQNEITYIPGGCQFNAMRVFNWMLDKDKTDIYRVFRQCWKSKYLWSNLSKFIIKGKYYSYF